MSASDLYFMLNPGLGIIKIGIAGDIDSRRRQIENACGVPLFVVASVAGGEAFEKPLHLAFDESRLIGEWFAPTTALLALVDDPSGIPAYLKEIAPAVQAREAAKLAMLEAQRTEEAKHRADEKARLDALKAEKQRIERQREARAAAARRKREEEQREAMAKREWATQTPYSRPDALGEAVNRRRVILETQRGKNAAMLGVVPITKLSPNQTQRPRQEGEAVGVN